MDCYLTLHTCSDRKEEFNIQYTLYEMLQVISISVFEKTPIKEIFNKQIQSNLKEQIVIG
jgi:hypothetical protein